MSNSCRGLVLQNYSYFQIVKFLMFGGFITKMEEEALIRNYDCARVELLLLYTAKQAKQA